MRVSCNVCGATWPVEGTPLEKIVCPVCAMGAQANAGGSPSGVEAENEKLIRGARRSRFLRR